MIKFQALMQAIHQSIQAASKAVESEGMRHVESFFEKVKTEKDSTQEDDKDSASAPSIGRVTHRPKMVAMEFPRRTAEGVETVVAHVPLITLTPISTAKVKEVKFTTHLDIANDDNGEDLLVTFSPGARKNLFGRSTNGVKTTNTMLEITLTGGETPEGLQQVIDGYERALRAQIPG
ncbi:DUF2589 domain-containing protein [Aestuariibacter halophilus]|uniref:DUF2589 domain-containing protein n=1 Tax=Fluctibacter halophilus TaxID=226011 RepID=A0ABS8G688_9ALTE|nr:DUF2589 domain-containing protein [Aestuariibacter halophilus]MCC2616112.1 DUF2589 domain-containing protein [Aestuariibacter halophilus]